MQMISRIKLNSPRYYTDESGNALLAAKESEVWYSVDKVRRYLMYLDSLSLIFKRHRKLILKHLEIIYDLSSKRSPASLVESCVDHWLTGSYIQMTDPVYVAIFIKLHEIVTSVYYGENDEVSLLAWIDVYKRRMIELKTRIFHDKIGVLRASAFEKRFNLVRV